MLAHFDMRKGRQHARNLLKRGDTILVRVPEPRAPEKFVRKLMREPERVECWRVRGRSGKFSNRNLHVAHV
jgi:hypothetical protein